MHGYSNEEALSLQCQQKKRIIFQEVDKEYGKKVKKVDYSKI